MISQLREGLRPARRQLNGLLRTRAVAALVRPRAVDDYLELIDPTWSVQDVRARVTQVRAATRRAVSLWLKPNEMWRGFRAGQYVQLSVRSRGVRYTRCFSISSAPEDGLPLRVTIQGIPDGRVSEWARQHVQVGDVVQMSQAQGEFVLPAVAPRRLLFITAGSGITPAMSMARHLTLLQYTGELYWLHYARDEVIFADELAELADALPGVRVFVQSTGRAARRSASRHFAAEQLERWVPCWRDCESYVCGPAPLLGAVSAHWQQHQLTPQLHVERFLPGRVAVPDPHAETLACQLIFQKSGREQAGHSSRSLLEQAEAAGLRPASGCRMGICHSCVCRKVSGVVRNELTGRVSSEPGEDIQLCISTPRSDVVLDL
jgi:ferredoxin-NADP reductase